jgi:hypothetical protein
MIYLAPKGVSRNTSFSEYLALATVEPHACRVPVPIWEPAGPLSCVARTPMERAAREHYAPISHEYPMCGSGRGASDTYVLRVEEMGRWYAPLIALLGLEREADDGWDLPGGCFYRRPRGGTCAEMADEIARWGMRVHDGSAARYLARLSDKSKSNSAAAVATPMTPRTSACGAAERAGGHRNATSACERLAHYYTAALAERVTRYAADDLATFGYPAWSGNITEPWSPRE